MMPTPEPRVDKPPKPPRAVAIAGIIFAILLTISIILIRRAVPAMPGDAARGSARIADAGSLVIGLNLLPFAGIIFLWFIGVIRDYIGKREDRFFATIVLGSGLLFIGMLFVAAGIAGGAIAGGIADSPVARLGGTVSYTIASVYAARMAGVFTFSTTILTNSVGLIPRWLAYLGFLFAIILLIGTGRLEWIFLLFPLWVLIFSVFILFHRPQRPNEPGTAS